VTEGARKGRSWPSGKKAWRCRNGKCRLTTPRLARRHAPLRAFHTARQKMQAEMDRSIAATPTGNLYDQPEKTKNKLRITGPFTVEAVPFPTVLSLEELPFRAAARREADASIAPAAATPAASTSGATSC
jgi:adenine-specific DNA-methyltransferase